MWGKVIKYTLIIVLFGAVVAACLFFSASRNMGDDAGIPEEEYDREPVIILKEEWNSYIDACDVQGSTTVFDMRAGRWYTSDTADMKVRTLPASTFKILNTLILLEEGVIASEKDSIYWPVAYDTTRYGDRPDIYNSMSLEEAFRKSAGWAYIKMAKEVSKNTYIRYFEQAAYGNGDLSADGTDFWNFGPFGVSPAEQISMLIYIYDQSLPFSDKHYRMLSDMMIVEKTDDYTLRAKTGWTRAGGKDTGWWVGYLENKENKVFFATRIIKDRGEQNPDFGACRKEITWHVLQRLGAV